MALKFIDSFDHYQTAEILTKWTSIGIVSPAIVAGAGRCNSQAVELGGIMALEKGIAFAATTGIFGFAYRPVTNLFTGTSFAYFAAPTGSGQHLVFGLGSDGSILAVRSEAGPVILGATPPDTIRLGNYYYIEIKATIDPTVGVVEIRVNGAVVLSLVGQNTKSSLSTGALTGVGFLSGGNSLFYFDDVYVVDDAGGAPWNTYLGDVRVEYLRPDGPGASQAWDLVGAGTHWQAVDDQATPDNDVSYIDTATLGLTDTETYLPTGLPAGTIYGVQVNLYTRKTDSGIRSIAPVIRHAGVDYVGLSQNPSFPSYVYLIQVYMTNPGTGVAWTIGDVNGMEVGAKVTL